VSRSGPSDGSRGDSGRGPAIIDLSGAERERAIPALRDSFVGIYRWHAKRTLREVSTVRAVESGGDVIGVSMLERLAPEVGYVYYLFVARAFRGRGIGGSLLDDALGRFLREGAIVAYAACEKENAASQRLFRSRRFREVGRKETGFREGGLGAWGYRSRMWIVPGEILLGLRLDAPPGGPVGDAPGP
jgi:L-amino acid N-acyltransferase YncA